MVPEPEVRPANVEPSEYARTQWGELLDRVQTFSQTVVITFGHKPQLAAVPLARWQQLAQEHGVSAESVERRPSKTARESLRAVMKDAVAGKPTIVTFRGREDLIAIVSFKLLPDDERAAAEAAAAAAAAAARSAPA
ncbi:MULTISPECIES: hypothetical protein [unclassified Amycolatopsis]|uniref:hypothetical protein n=1 Tax=unclassified Amycolatopsis TaxID=2618356 RepID=UPI002875B1DD|nr:MULTISPECIES: hypothetical protein [unclassified Amycolatopsis]MDS0140613.1 hypothetical protein [Amycolatopsis sp. 505]MDS0149263.1 hypothetical protein [Amycolatopsis sp. CM201R]